LATGSPRGRPGSQAPALAAGSRAAYDAAFDDLFATLDALEARLSRQRYLVGRTLTEADWRLFPTLVRFDVARGEPRSTSTRRMRRVDAGRRDRRTLEASREID
jgi:glutathione S-transferase